MLRANTISPFFPQSGPTRQTQYFLPTCAGHMKNFSHSFTIARSLDDAFDLVFNDRDTLDAVHGAGRWTATPWEDGRRDIRFEMHPGSIPPAILRMIGNGRMAARVRQTAVVKADEIVVSNRVRPCVVGAEFVRIRPTFTLSRVADKGTRVGMTCDVCAIMPPPFNGMIEDFMKRTADVSFSWLEAAISEFVPATL